MALARDSKATQLAQLDTEDKQLFRKLATSRPEFDSVGSLFCVVENNKAKYTVTHSNISFSGEPTTTLNVASGVYIGDHIVITAAHCVPQHIKNDEFISDLTKHWYFHADCNNETTASRVIKAIRFPKYIHAKNITFENAQYDLAVLLLDRDPANIKKAELHTDSYSMLYDCTAVGYSDLIIPRPQDDKKRTPIEQTANILKPRVAVTIPYCDYFNGRCVNTIGADFVAKGDKQNEDTYDITNQIRKYNPSEAGVYYGMSGGGWFTGKGKVFAISSSVLADSKSPVPTDGKVYNNVTGDLQLATSLHPHQSWLDSSIQSLRAELPKLKFDILEWHRKREQHEFKLYPDAKQKRAELESKFAIKVKKNPNLLPFFLRNSDPQAKSNDATSTSSKTTEASPSKQQTNDAAKTKMK